MHRDKIGKGFQRESISLSRLSNFQSTSIKIKCDLQWLLFTLLLNIHRWRHMLEKKKSQTLGIYLSLCIKVYPSTISAEFKITANRLTTVFLPLQMKNIRKLGEYSASQFVLTARCYLQCLFDRTDILYCCEMGKRVTFLFMVAYALVMISPGRCAYCSSPEPSENKQELEVPAVRLPY